jgi:hypothetical protein
MSWVKVDDLMHLHRKIRLVPMPARWLYMAMLCHSSHYLTDGFVSAQDLPLVEADIKDPEKVAGELASHGLLHRAGDRCAGEDCPAGRLTVQGEGWILHDFWEYNPPADRAKARREADRDRKRRTSGRIPDGVLTESERSPDGFRPENHFASEAFREDSEPRADGSARATRTPSRTPSPGSTTPSPSPSPSAEAGEDERVRNPQTKGWESLAPLLDHVNGGDRATQERPDLEECRRRLHETWDRGLERRGEPVQGGRYASHGVGNLASDVHHYKLDLDDISLRLERYIDERPSGGGAGGPRFDAARARRAILDELGLPYDTRRKAAER